MLKLELEFEFGEDLVCSNRFHGETVNFDFVFASVSYPDLYLFFRRKGSEIIWIWLFEGSKI